MASPQVEDGYTKIANELLEAFWRVNLSAYESRILWALIRKTYGYGKKMDRIPLSQFMKDTGIDRRNAHRTLRNLEERKLIVVCRDDKRRPSYGFQKNYEKWKTVSMDKVVVCRDDKVSSVEMTKLSSVETPSKEIKETKQKKDAHAHFAQFWKAYPRRVDKKRALKIWEKLKPDEELTSTILDAVEKQKQARERKKANGEFTPEWAHPSTWLNNERWNDEIDPEEMQSEEEQDVWGHIPSR